MGKSKRKSRIKSNRKSMGNIKLPNMYDVSVKKSTMVTQPLTIYTSPGCPACTDVKKRCDKKGIKYFSFNRKDHSEYVKKKTGNCRYVPNIFNSKKEYIGGNEDLEKLTKNMIDI